MNIMSATDQGRRDGMLNWVSNADGGLTKSDAHGATVASTPRRHAQIVILPKKEIAKLQGKHDHCFDEFFAKGNCHKDTAQTSCMVRLSSALLRFLNLHSSAGVSHLNVKLRSAVQDCQTLPRANIVRNFGTVEAVLHEKDIQLVDVVDEILVEAVRQNMAGLAVGTVTDVGHANLSTPLAADTRINTLRTAP